MDTDRKKVWDLLKEVRDDVKELLGVMIQRTVQRGSPLTLTPLGEKVAEEIEVDRWVEHLVPKTQHEVEGMEPYEVQEFCRKFVRDYVVGGTLRRRLLGAAFDNGLREDEVRDVIAIRLRDHFLALQEASDA